MENRSNDPELKCEHGLSFHIQTPDRSVVFDTGQSGDSVGNAEKMGIDLSKLDAVVFSHGHYDHTDGYPRLATVAGNIPVFQHPGAGIERYSIKDPEHPKYIGMSEHVRQRLCDTEVVSVDKPTAVGDYITCTGPVPRVSDFEDTGGPFFLDREGEAEDAIVDDQALILSTREGVVLLLGCAHSGVVNTLELCRRIRPGVKIHAIIGGFHLLNATRERLATTYHELATLNPTTLAPCHCTGEVPMREIAEQFSETFADCRVGSRFEFEVE